MVRMLQRHPVVDRCRGRRLAVAGEDPVTVSFRLQNLLLKTGHKRPFHHSCGPSLLRLLAGGHSFVQNTFVGESEGPPS